MYFIQQPQQRQVYQQPYGGMMQPANSQYMNQRQQQQTYYGAPQQQQQQQEYMQQPPRSSPSRTNPNYYSQAAATSEYGSYPSQPGIPSQQQMSSGTNNNAQTAQLMMMMGLNTSTSSATSLSPNVAPTSQQPNAYSQSSYKSPHKLTSTSYTSPQQQQSTSQGYYSPSSIPPASPSKQMYYSSPQQYSSPPANSQPSFFSSLSTASAAKEPSSPYRTMQSFFMNENLRQLLLNKSNFVYQTVDPASEVAKYIPKAVQEFHTLFPLDSVNKLNNPKIISKTLKLPTEVYKAISSVNATSCTIRRVSMGGAALSPPSESTLTVLEHWKSLKHPNIVNFRKFFQSSDFTRDASSDWIFVFDYHPGAVTLDQHYLFDTIRAPPENILWSYICQLVSAIKAIHGAGLSCKGIIHPSKVLLFSGKRRIMLNCGGIPEVIGEKPAKETSLAVQQDEDIQQLGQLILCLAAKSYASLENPAKTVEQLTIKYSAELTDFLKYLLNLSTNTAQPQTAEAPLRNIQAVVTMISSRILEELSQMHNQYDFVESELSKELENGRLFRLLTKLNYVAEAADFEQTWNESGDRYILKLFYDYLFHQVSEEGLPIIDFAHVIDTLNKLDAGIPEKLLLMSRDEQSLLVVTYKDLKQYIQADFNQMLGRNMSV